ncbi:CD209 antigen-like protein E [Stegastes partitus]|uniref:CD209 antigen-like protein E n=1 Tax=Stegastes partitus TaxID=144197 RepID=A0A3B5B2B3_9TELE|nr:PREDICTED: CD209 antigen-like protein E [Stegastes partitus]
MVRAAHREASEMITENVNLPDASTRSKDGEAGRKVFRLVAVSFGLLCILQAVLNISLRVAFYSRTSDVKIICNNVSESDELRKLAEYHFQQGWIYIHPSFYYISSTRKSWQDSREDCLQRGADLVIIDSKEEQDFTRKFHRLTWIGLTDRVGRREWKWVDGTPLTKSYWGPGEPNSYRGKKEDCVEIKFHDNENSWNDIPCEDLNFWICEKKLDL